MSSSEPGRKKGRAPLARYANYFEIGHNAFEFVIDAGQVEPDSGDIQLHSRVVVGPTHAKLFARLLAGAVAQFETVNGQIPDVIDEDPADAILASLPDFERRAIDARRQPAASPAATHSQER